jgi:rhodanese-related sulfurtransferase
MLANVNLAECDAAELAKHLEKGGRNLIDVREYPEFASERVRGAKLIPLGEIERRQGEINRDQTVYVMCRSGKRGSEAQKKLKALGFRQVINVRGGIEAWKRGNLPVEKDETSNIWDPERQVRFTAGLLVLTGVVLSIFVHPFSIGLSGFVGAGLVFAAVTNTCGMGMMLARMPWNRRRESCEVNGSDINCCN